MEDNKDSSNKNKTILLENVKYRRLKLDEKSAKINKELAKINKKLMKIYEENKKIKQEIFYNRVCIAVFLVLTLFYLHYELSNLKDTLGILIQMFL